MGKTETKREIRRKNPRTEQRWRRKRNRYLEEEKRSHGLLSGLNGWTRNFSRGPPLLHEMISEPP